MTCRRAVAGLAVALAVLSSATPANAQRASRSEIDAAVDARLAELWTRFLAEAARDAGLTVADRRLTGARDAKVAVYTKVLERLRDDAELLALFTPAYVQALIDEQVESRVPTSVNATSTNPMTAGLPERSGSTSLLALAADLASVASADKTAISLNVNALALVTLKDSDLYSSIADYQRHSLARRFSGTVVFGAEIPESEITGFSGFPDFDRLLDTFGWDVKVRVWGDKDPRSARWSPTTVRAGGLLTQKAAVLLSLVGTAPRAGEPPQQALEDAAIVQSLLATQVGEGLAAIKSRIAKAPQLSVKAAGTHLTQEARPEQIHVRRALRHRPRAIGPHAERAVRVDRRHPARRRPVVPDEDLDGVRRRDVPPGAERHRGWPNARLECRRESGDVHRYGLSACADRRHLEDLHQRRSARERRGTDPGFHHLHK